MRPSKTCGSPGPVATTTSNRAFSSSSSSNAHRGAHDISSFASLAGQGGFALSGDASLASQDLMERLLRLARGDLTAAPTLAAVADGTGVQGTEASGHAAAAVRGGTATLGDNNTSSSSGGGGGGGGQDGGRCDPQGKAVRARDGVVPASSPSAPLLRNLRPVSVLCPSADRKGEEGPQPSLAAARAAAASLSSESTCVSTEAEACAFYLTALVAYALHMEDYWVDLGHQIEVDQHVEFVQFCAEAGFKALKTIHLLQWWRQFRTLVRDPTATYTLQLSDGNQQGPSSSLASSETASNPAAGGGGQDAHHNHNHHHNSSNGSGAASSAGGGGGGGGGTRAASKKGCRSGANGAAATTTAAATAAPGAAGDADTDGDAPGGMTTTAYPSHEAAVHAELQRFLQWELEHDYEWRLVPREPFTSVAAAANGLLASVGGAGGGPTTAGGGAAASAAAAAGAANGVPPPPPVAVGKSSKAEKAKMQQQQQQEMEMEEQRLARIAALPPANIFLTASEMNSFMRVVVVADLLQHASLHAYVATQVGPPTHTLTDAATAPVCFSVQVETPMPVLPLREATRLVMPAAVSPFASPRPSGDVAEGHNNTTATTNNGNSGAQHPPSRPAGSVPSKPRSRGNSKNTAATATNTNAHASTAADPAEAAAAVGADELASTRQLNSAVSPSAMEALRAEQAREAVAYRAAYAEELAQAATQAQQAQHAADVSLFFEKASIKTAVQAVYASMEDAVAVRQQRILQRVAALEQALGLTENPGEGSAGPEAPQQ